MTQSPPPQVSPPVPPPYCPPAPRTNGMAIASLILGVLSLAGCCCCLWVAPAVLAVVFGHVGLSQIQRSQGRMNGRGLAIAGLVCGYVALALHLALTAFWIIMAACNPEHGFMWHRTYHGGW